jgi:hypothetical protein
MGFLSAAGPLSAVSGFFQSVFSARATVRFKFIHHNRGTEIVFRALMSKPAKTVRRSDWFQPPLEVSGARSLSDHSVVTL